MKRLSSILLITMVSLLLSSCGGGGGTSSGTSGSGSLELLSPNGGETWYAQGSTNPTITWTQSDAGDSVRIEMYKSDALFLTLTVATENDGEYSLEIPSTTATSGDYTVKIVSLLDGAITDVSESSFTIINTQVDTNPSSITVNRPNGGETWQTTETQNITWNSSNAGNSVNVDLYKSGNYSLGIAQNTANDGAYSWSIPSTVFTSSDYKIKITSSGDASVTDESDANLTITASSSITVTSPNGGPSWMGGSTQTITWTSSNAGSSVDIHLYKGAQRSSTIASSTANDGSTAWTVPITLTAGSDYKIKVADASNSDTWDKSTSFTITRDPQSTYDAVEDNFDNVTADAESLLSGCDNGGSMTLKSNGTQPIGRNKTWVCSSENTNSIANLLMDHYHFSGYINPIDGDSLTWDWGSEDGYLYIKGKPTDECLIKFTSTVPNPSTGQTKTFSKEINMTGKGLSQCPS